MMKNKSFYRAFDRNRSIEMIDGYDGTVHRGLFHLSHGRPISINASISLLGSRSDGLDFPRAIES